MRCRLPAPAPSLSLIGCLRSDLLYQKGVLAGPFSVGEDKEILVRDEESLMLELTAMLETDSMLGYWLSSWSVSSSGRQVSTRASRQLTNSSTFSALQLDLVKNPANLHKPPKPQLCRKCSCCWLVSSQLIMFSMILCTAPRIVLS